MPKPELRRWKISLKNGSQRFLEAPTLEEAKSKADRLRMDHVSISLVSNGSWEPVGCELPTFRYRVTLTDGTFRDTEANNVAHARRMVEDIGHTVESIRSLGGSDQSERASSETPLHGDTRDVFRIDLADGSPYEVWADNKKAAREYATKRGQVVKSVTTVRQVSVEKLRKGLCIGGPMTGQIYECKQESFEVAEVSSKALDVRATYQWTELLSIGVWTMSDHTVEQALQILVDSYQLHTSMGGKP